MVTDNLARRYYVLRIKPYDNAFMHVFEDALTNIEKETGMMFEYTLHDDAAPGIVRRVYIDDENDVILSLVDDFDTETRYLMVEATSEKMYDLDRLLSTRLDISSLEELQHYAKKNMEHEPSSMIKMALGTASNADPLSLRIIRSGIQNSDRNIRMKAIEAAIITQWKELLSDLEYLVDNDLDPEIRKFAKEILDAR
jgi:hypothetical protein